MKRIFFFCLVVLLSGSLIYSQHLIRVNNDPDTDADYTTLQDAHDNASGNDTIYVEGSTILYDAATISKKLAIIGPGYFLTENDSTQASGMDAFFDGTITFDQGSEGSVITGCHFSDMSILTDNVIVTRCYGNNIYINGTCNNILISRNFVINILNWAGKLTNSIVANNIVSYSISTMVTDGPLQVVNNILTGLNVYALNCYNSGISNNIICYEAGEISVNSGNTISNNILASPGTNANGNQYNVDMSGVFADYSGTNGYSTDGMWQLKAGSPAIGAGVGGVDCGAFGGPAPYVLSGVPALPHIYEVSLPGTAYSSEGFTGTIKVKSGK